MKDDRERIPGTLDVISVNSMALLLPILGALVLAVCLVVYAVTGDEYWTIQTLSCTVTMGGVMCIAGAVRIRRHRVLAVSGIHFCTPSLVVQAVVIQVQLSVARRFLPRSGQ